MLGGVCCNVLFLLATQLVIVAVEQIVIVVVEVHAVALAELPHLALGALALAGPLAVAELAKTILPHLPQVVAVDVALVEPCTNARTTTNRAVYLHTRNAHSRHTAEEVIPHLGLVAAQEALAGVVALDFALLAGLDDEIHKPAILLGR